MLNSDVIGWGGGGGGGVGGQTWLRDQRQTKWLPENRERSIRALSSPLTQLSADTHTHTSNPHTHTHTSQRHLHNASVGVEITEDDGLWCWLLSYNTTHTCHLLRTLFFFKWKPDNIDDKVALSRALFWLAWFCFTHWSVWTCDALAAEVPLLQCLCPPARENPECGIYPASEKNAVGQHEKNAVTHCGHKMALLSNKGLWL